jgi:hypothetical protein
MLAAIHKPLTKANTAPSNSTEYENAGAKASSMIASANGMADHLGRLPDRQMATPNKIEPMAPSDPAEYRTDNTGPAKNPATPIGMAEMSVA